MSSEHSVREMDDHSHFNALDYLSDASEGFDKLPESLQEFHVLDWQHLYLWPLGASSPIHGCSIAACSRCHVHRLHTKRPGTEPGSQSGIAVARSKPASISGAVPGSASSLVTRARQRWPRACHPHITQQSPPGPYLVRSEDLARVDA